MSDSAIISAIRIAAGTHNMQFVEIVECEVTAVDIPTRTCTCTPLSGKNSSDITSVRLMGTVDDGFLLAPAIGSTVVVHYSARNQPYIAVYSAIQSVVLIATTSIQFQGGELGGLVIAQNTAERLNLIENAFNTLNAKVSTLLAEPVIPPLALTQAADIENDFITHGGA